ncbi:MAG: hypothetical protein K8F92_21165 [Hyphomicrobium sp.]|uniref:hypothetical protein n=1 Tax=Hyphomicrobium sp. TaxID=82 RepID=UPI001320C204|nr:hypothetical protein [Hyphomicrobium sp.]KAB2937228.1 MAG: hypothetical protein F9K20_20395 [Hyphomicrobium sp.]MBZ0212147.1 hypothetical protein [Hyphomicrobium sp.]
MQRLVITSEDFQALRIAINAALVEVGEREMELSVADITLRLLDAYLMGERDPKKLADAIVFNTAKGYVN